MNEQELRTQLLEAGANKEDLNKIDFAKSRQFQKRQQMLKVFARHLKKTIRTSRKRGSKKPYSRYQKIAKNQKSFLMNSWQMLQVEVPEAGSKRTKTHLLPLVQLSAS